MLVLNKILAKYLLKCHINVSYGMSGINKGGKNQFNNKVLVK